MLSVSSHSPAFQTTAAGRGTGIGEAMDSQVLGGPLVSSERAPRSDCTYSVGSGVYSFAMGKPLAVVCVSNAPSAVRVGAGADFRSAPLRTSHRLGTDAAVLQLECPQANMSISAIDFASYGTPTGVCGLFNYHRCHAPNTRAIVERTCLSYSSCTLTVSASVFGSDPACGLIVPAEGMWLSVQAQCVAF